MLNHNVNWILCNTTMKSTEWFFFIPILLNFNPCDQGTIYSARIGSKGGLEGGDGGAR